MLESAKDSAVHRLMEFRDDGLLETNINHNYLRVSLLDCYILLWMKAYLPAKLSFCLKLSDRHEPAFVFHFTPISVT
jgi:hypothetical protein